MTRSTAARRLGAIGAAGAVVTATALGMATQAQAAASTWAPTATHALTLKHATLLGAAPTATPLRLTVGLTPRDRAGIDSLIKAQATPGNANYQKYLTPAQFTSRFAATSATATSVRNYLTSQGMSNVSVASNRLQVTADATVGQAEKAFNTSISTYRQAGKQVLANTADAEVPASLGGKVSGVLGLSTLGFTAAPQVSAPKLTGYYPKEFNTVYDSGSTAGGKGQSLAVIAEGDLTQTVKDLRTAEAAQHLRKIPVTLVPTGIASTDTAGVDEWDLDTQTSTGIAPQADRLYIYISTSLTNSDLARSINRFVADDNAKTGSASLGECDILPFLDGSMVVDDIALAQAAVQGQTFFASSGDTGSSCAVAPTNGVPGGGLPDTEYPASSPYTTAVGGTTLLTDEQNNYTSEVTWNAGGGGASPVENAGYWQAPVNVASTAGVRGVPDVAFDADPDTGGLIYVNGSVEQIGGTSLSSPLAMGLWTRLVATNKKIGFASVALYGTYTRTATTTSPVYLPGTAFHDITVGTNGANTALPGYDLTTGLGSWDVQYLSIALRSAK